MTGVRFGIAGAGLIAGKNVAALKSCQLSEVTMVGARNPEKAKAFQETHGLPNSGSLEAVCDAPDIDAVYLCVPTAVRTRWALRCIENGKHVLVEKPAGANAEDVTKMVQAARKKGVIFMDGTMWLQATRTDHLRKVLHDEQRIGDIVNVHSALTAFFPKEAVEQGIRGQVDLEPAGGIGDMAWYTVGSTLFSFKYQMPHRVTCFSQRCGNGSFYQCSGRLEWKDGRCANFDAGYGGPLRQYIEICGTKGMIRVPDLVNPPLGSIDSFIGPSTAKPETFWQVIDNGGFWISGQGEIIKVPDVTETHEVEMFRKFCEAVESKTQNESWIESATCTQRVIDALVRSAEKDGEYVSL